MQLGYLGNNLYRTVTVLVVAVILLWTCSSGWSKGEKTAQAEQIIANADIVVKGLDFFYNDQDRYPTAGEFASDNMARYFSVFPMHNFASSQCPETFSYKRNSSTEYILGFCLPMAASGFQQGWNSFVQNR